MNLLLSKSFAVVERVERLSNSLGLDIYNLSNGKTKTIKHIQLGITTKRKTGSRLKLDSLNCLGHSVFYDEVNNVETSFAELKVKNESNRLFVPKNVQPSLFVTFICENCEIIQKPFLVHLSLSQMASLSSFQAKLKKQNSQ